MIKRIFITVILALFPFGTGIFFDRLFINFPLLQLDPKINILQIASLVVTVVIAFLIPLYVNKLIEDKRGAKSFIIEELKELIKITFKIKDVISNAHEIGVFTSKDRDTINYIFHEAELKIFSIQEQIKEAFEHNVENTSKNLSSLVSVYKEHVTGGELMHSGFNKVDERYYRENNTKYSKLETGLKKFIQSVYKF